MGLAGLRTDNLGLYGTRPELFYNYHISTKVELQANVIYVLTLFTTARLVVKKSVCISGQLLIWYRSFLNWSVQNISTYPESQ